jgi:outer membrane protein assembly factor BamB
MPRKLLSLGVLACSWLLASGVSADWLRFRGPNGSGVSSESDSTPVKWSPEENVKWTVELPGAGVSSPIVVGDRVYVTCYSGYGMDRQNPGDINELKRHLVCVDRGSGKILWDKSVKAALPEDPYSGMGVPSHGYASHTPVSDGENVYVFFGKSGVFAFDKDGDQLWQRSVGSGSDDKRWGSSSSPILHDDLLIVTASAESRALVGLNKKTGEEVWRQETDGLTDVWGTPLLVNIEDRTDLVIGVPYEFWGLNPATGKLRWYSEAMNTDSYNSSVVEADGVIYGIEGRGGGSAAVKAGGKGDVTASNTVWSGNDSARFGTPLVYDGRVYYFSNGVANCISAEDGTSVFKGRLPSTSSRGGGNREGDANRRGPGGGGDGQPGGRPQGGFGGGQGGFGGSRGGFGGGRGGFGSTDYSSPVAADGKIYYLKSDGTTLVLSASDEFELLASNQIASDPETFAATPAISQGQIFLRSSKRLYCVANE